MRLEHEIEIAAPIGEVWAITEAIEQWPDLTPTMDSVEHLDDGPLAVGARARIKQPRLPIAEWLVTELQPERRLSWKSRSRGVTTVATHILEPAADGGTRMRIVADVSGFPARLLWPVIRGMARRFIEQEAAGFKAYCEAG